MLTRKSVQDDADSEHEESAEELDKLMNLSPRAMARYEKALDAELEELHRYYQSKLVQLDRVTRYRFERRRALVNILRTRNRLDKFLKVEAFDFVCETQRIYIKDKQKELLSLRWRLRTGVDGGRA
jgi:BMFP domain-containing protein YqiC